MLGIHLLGSGLAGRTGGEGRVQGHVGATWRLDEISKDGEGTFPWGTWRTHALLEVSLRR